MVTAERFPPDIRIEKEAEVLSQAGHEILVFASESTQTSRAEPQFGVFEYQTNATPCSDFGKLRYLFRKNSIELVHLQDTPGSLQGFLAAKSLGLRVIYDMHEIWPSLVVDNSRNLTFGATLWSTSLHIEEAVAFMGADVSLTVVEEAVDYLARKYKFADNVFPIRNFERLGQFRSIRPSQDFKDEQYFRVTYVGGLEGPMRGIEEVILAAARLSKEDIQFLFVGSGSHLEWLQLLARKLGLQKKIRFLGSKSFHDAMQVVAASDLCLVPHKKCISTQHTLPHKISQYMALGKPVISTNLAPITRLFHSAFLPWEPRTPQKLVELINSARENRNQTQHIAQSGHTLVSEKYKWEEEGKRLVTIYENLSPK